MLIQYIVEDLWNAIGQNILKFEKHTHVYVNERQMAISKRYFLVANDVKLTCYLVLQLFWIFLSARVKQNSEKNDRRSDI